MMQHDIAVPHAGSSTPGTFSHQGAAVYAITFPYAGTWDAMMEKVNALPGEPIHYRFGMFHQGPVVANDEAQILLLSPSAGQADAIADALRGKSLDDVRVTQQLPPVEASPDG
jgi:hypothetical protein